METHLLKNFANLLAIDSVHDDNNIRPILFEKLRANNFMSGTWHVMTLSIWIYIDNKFDFLRHTKGCQERHAL